MPASTRLPDGTISVGSKSGSDVHTIEITPAAQRQFFQHLLASKADDPLGSTAVRLTPQGVGRFQVDQRRGITFLLNMDAGVHVLMEKALADALLHLLQTWDDPSTWDLKTPTAQ